MKKVALPWALLGAACGALAAAPPPECFVQCERGPGCQVEHHAGRLDLGLGESRKVEDCASAKLLRGDALRALVMTKGGLKRFSVTRRDTGRPFREVAQTLFAHSVCLGINPGCGEARDQARISTTAAKGIDRAATRRAGSPCAIGLPCGEILLPRSPVAFAVEGFVGDGTWIVRAVRGEGEGGTYVVRQGRVEWGPHGLRPGGAYGYSLRDAGGNEVAAGEFTVLSARMQADVEAELAAAGAASTFDAVEVLLANELWWDAMQRSR